MIHALGDKEPDVAEGVFVAWNAEVVGDVTLEAGSSVWYSATLRGDVASITVGEDSNVQDGAVIHADAGNHVRVGKRVTIGHRAILHGCVVEDDCLIGMGAIVLDNATIGEGSVIGAGAFIKSGAVIPPRSLVVGSPGKVIRQLTDENVDEVRKNAVTYRDLADEAYLEPDLGSDEEFDYEYEEGEFDEEDEEDEEEDGDDEE
jgi:carbonic anhydrase/acetyltransferase-like protein (isoleucine patch superfamily)